MTLDADVQKFSDQLELSDLDQLLETFALTVDGKKLSVEEAKRFIAFIRAERSLN